MSNNSTRSYGNSRCDKFYFQAGIDIEIPVYYSIVPSCILLGVIGHVVCLLAYYRQSKKEPAYFYQVALTVSQMFGYVFYAGYCSVMIFSYWNPSGGSVWFMTNYVLVWYVAHFAVPLTNISHSIDQLIAISMAADRVFAIWKPMIYKNIRHKLHQTIAILFCITLGVSTSLFDCFRYTSPVFSAKSKYYSISINNAFLQTDVAKGLSQFRDAFRLGGLIVLIALNVALTALYQKRMRQVAQMTDQTLEGRKAKKKAKGEMTLVLLTSFQCLFNAVNTTAVAVYYVALSIKPSFDSCEAYLWGPILDAASQLVDVADFYVVLIVSKQFRRMIAEHLPCLKRFGDLMSFSHSN